MTTNKDIVKLYTDKVRLDAAVKRIEEFQEKLCAEIVVSEIFGRATRTLRADACLFCAAMLEDTRPKGNN